MHYDKTKVLRLQAIIHTLSPVHIGAGDDLLSPLMDYVQEGDRIHLIDKGELASQIADSGHTDKYMRGIRTVSDQRKSGFLREFSDNHLKESLDRFYTGEEIPSFLNGNPIEISRCIRTHGMPFIPGSSLKGALRSALLHHWLMSREPDALAAFDNWIQHFEQTYKRLLRTLEQPDVRRNKGRQKKEIQKATAEITRAFDREIEEALFGNLKIKKRLPMSAVLLSDSDTVNGSTAIYEIERKNLGEGKDGPVTVKECIQPGAKTWAGILIDRNQLEHHETQRQGRWLSKVLKDREGLCKIINAHSLAMLRYEMEVLDEVDGAEMWMEDFRERLDDILDQIQGAAAHVAFHRLGQGKMQFYQTIALKVFQHYGKNEQSAQWGDYLSICAGTAEEGVPYPYPGTRALTSIGTQALGWVKIEFHVQ